MTDFDKGFVAGVIVMAILWTIFAWTMELDKVRNGYLTFNNIRYSVVVFDTLDIPEKQE